MTRNIDGILIPEFIFLFNFIKHKFFAEIFLYDIKYKFITSTLKYFIISRLQIIWIKFKNPSNLWCHLLYQGCVGKLFDIFPCNEDIHYGPKMILRRNCITMKNDSCYGDWIFVFYSFFQQFYVWKDLNIFWLLNVSKENVIISNIYLSFATF